MSADPFFTLLRDICTPPTAAELRGLDEAVRAAARCQKPWRNPALEEVAMRVARLPMTTEADRKEKWAIIDTLAELDKRTNVAPEVLPPCPNPTSA